MYETFKQYNLYIWMALLISIDSASAKVSYGLVSSGNYTSYKCSTSGDLRLTLETIEGDADIYIKEGNVHVADYENYDLKSATCGLDYVDVPVYMKRPFCISVYGHPTFDNSTYKLTISRQSLSDYDDDVYEAPNKKVHGEEQESIIITILKFILEFLFEVLV